MTPYHQLPSNWCWKSFFVWNSIRRARSCVKVKVAILGSSSLVSLTVSVDVKQHWERNLMRARSCVKVKVAILGSSSLVSLMVSVDVKQHWERNLMRAHEPRESQGGCTGLPVPKSLYSLYGRKATQRKELDESSWAAWKSRWLYWAPCP